MKCKNLNYLSVAPRAEYGLTSPKKIGPQLSLSKRIFLLLTATGASLLALAGESSRAEDSILVYVSAPNVQSAEDSGLVDEDGNSFNSELSTETFSDATAGALTNYVSTSTGITYTGTGSSEVKANDRYGGYGEGNYLSVNTNQSVTLTLAADQAYFGFYFTAGDSRNIIQFYNDGVLVYTFSTASLLSLIPQNTTITAIDGEEYSTNDYYGQPTSGLNPNEPYAYLNFVASDGISFDTIVLSQGNNANFESDNHSLATIAPTVPDAADVVPEPSVMVLASIAFGFAIYSRRFPRRRSYYA